MMNREQIKEEVFNALDTNANLTALIPGGLQQVGVKKASGFPQLVYNFFDDTGGYSFQTVKSFDTITIQTEVYADSPNDIDKILDQVEITMTALCYRKIASPETMVDTDIDKNVRPVRWEKIYV